MAADSDSTMDVSSGWGAFDGRSDSGTQSISTPAGGCDELNEASIWEGSELQGPLGVPQGTNIAVREELAGIVVDVVVVAMVLVVEGNVVVVDAIVVEVLLVLEKGRVTCEGERAPAVPPPAARIAAIVTLASTSTHRKAERIRAARRS